jgi:hypothetical protein
MFRKTLATAALTVAFLFVPVAANALHCNNVSRPPAECGSACPPGDPIVNGNWVWLPSVFPEAPATWVFVPPGSLAGEPVPFGQKGNFQNGEGDALLVNAICNPDGTLRVPRQTEHGIQLLGGCPQP